MSFTAFDNGWWPIFFILVAGWIATDIWRWMGVLLGRKLDETAEILVFVRAVATALVAGVIAQLIVYPSGALAQETSMILRIVAAGCGFLGYMLLGRSVGIGVLIALIVLVGGMLAPF